MTADGYGVCYAMLDGRMNIAITSWHSCAHTCSDRMRETLSATLCDMHTLFHAVDAVEPKPKL
jgi:hypothetical protein